MALMWPLMPRLPEPPPPFVPTQEQLRAERARHRVAWVRDAAKVMLGGGWLMEEVLRHLPQLEALAERLYPDDPPPP